MLVLFVKEGPIGNFEGIPPHQTLPSSSDVFFQNSLFKWHSSIQSHSLFGVMLVASLSYFLPKEKKNSPVSYKKVIIFFEEQICLMHVSLVFESLSPPHQSSIDVSFILLLFMHTINSLNLQKKICPNYQNKFVIESWTIYLFLTLQKWMSFAN